MTALAGGARKATGAGDGLGRTVVSAAQAATFVDLFCLKLALSAAVVPAVLAVANRVPVRAATILTWVLALAGAVLARSGAGVRSRFAGLLALLVVTARHVAGDFPMTINHDGLEVFVVLVLWFVHLRATRDGPGGRDADPWYLVQALYVSVWLWAAVQKVVHGQFLTGETFGLAVTSGGHLGGAIRAILGALGIAAPEPAAACCVTGEAGLSGTAAATVVLLSAGVVLAELAVPLAAVWWPSAASWWALAGLVVASATISGELDFGATNAAFLALFLPARCRRALVALVVGLQLLVVRRFL